MITESTLLSITVVAGTVHERTPAATLVPFARIGVELAFGVLPIAVGAAGIAVIKNVENRHVSAFKNRFAFVFHVHQLDGRAVLA